jgi:hypothetical protein
MLVSGTFKLLAQIHNVPAGATGQLNVLRSGHVALIFDDNRNYEDLVFDIHDTEPEIWAAIAGQAHTVSPSLTDPPWRLVAVASLVLAALIVSIPYAQAVTEVFPHLFIPYLY